MTTRQFAALIGFAFVAAWIAFGLADAVLCALAALACHYVAGAFLGDVDFGELQSRFVSRGRAYDPPPPRPRVR